MRQMVSLLTARAEWGPLLLLAAALVLARRLRAGLALAALLGAASAAAGLAGVLFAERLLYALSVPQAFDEARFLGLWRWLLPLLAAAGCALPVAIRWHGVRRLQHTDAILAGAALLLLGAAWTRPMLP